MTSTILVTFASKYGSTRDIADVVGRVLTEHGVDVTVSPVEDVTSVHGVDAVVAGSAVYAGHWMKPAREFVERHATELKAKPVWLFSSGPIGDPPKPQEDPVDASSLVELTGARDHRVFAGKLDRHALSFGEKAIVMALRAPEGDFRDWDEIREWAAGIARAIQAVEAG
jgi:menaquinone-dependent protoporphyrinogen oxidase